MTLPLCSRPGCGREAAYRVDLVLLDDGSQVYTCIECLPSLIMAMFDAAELEWLNLAAEL